VNERHAHQVVATGDEAVKERPRHVGVDGDVDGVTNQVPYAYQQRKAQGIAIGVDVKRVEQHGTGDGNQKRAYRRPHYVERVLALGSSGFASLAERCPVRLGEEHHIPQGTQHKISRKGSQHTQPINGSQHVKHG
nr:hypothetical protein [Tanacetum cinerariifolium]